MKFSIKLPGWFVNSSFVSKKAERESVVPRMSITFTLPEPEDAPFARNGSDLTQKRNLTLKNLLDALGDTLARTLARSNLSLWKKQCVESCSKNLPASDKGSFQFTGEFVSMVNSGVCVVKMATTGRSIREILQAYAVLLNEIIKCSSEKGATLVTGTTKLTDSDKSNPKLHRRMSVNIDDPDCDTKITCLSADDKDDILSDCPELANLISNLHLNYPKESSAIQIAQEFIFVLDAATSYLKRSEDSEDKVQTISEIEKTENLKIPDVAAAGPSAPVDNPPKEKEVQTTPALESNPFEEKVSQLTGEVRKLSDIHEQDQKERESLQKTIAALQQHLRGLDNSTASLRHDLTELTRRIDLLESDFGNFLRKRDRLNQMLNGDLQNIRRFEQDLLTRLQEILIKTNLLQNLGHEQNAAVAARIQQLRLRTEAHLWLFGTYVAFNSLQQDIVTQKSALGWLWGVVVGIPSLIIGANSSTSGVLVDKVASLSPLKISLDDYGLSQGIKDALTHVINKTSETVTGLNTAAGAINTLAGVGSFVGGALLAMNAGLCAYLWASNRREKQAKQEAEKLSKELLKYAFARLARGQPELARAILDIVSGAPMFDPVTHEPIPNGSSAFELYQIKRWGISASALAAVLVPIFIQEVQPSQALKDLVDGSPELKKAFGVTVGDRLPICPQVRIEGGILSDMQQRIKVVETLVIANGDIETARAILMGMDNPEQQKEFIARLYLENPAIITKIVANLNNTDIPDCTACHVILGALAYYERNSLPVALAPEDAVEIASAPVAESALKDALRFVVHNAYENQRTDGLLLKTLSRQQEILAPNGQEIARVTTDRIDQLADNYVECFYELSVSGTRKKHESGFHSLGFFSVGYAPEKQASIRTALNDLYTNLHGNLAITEETGVARAVTIGDRIDAERDPLKLNLNCFEYAIYQIFLKIAAEHIVDSAEAVNKVFKFCLVALIANVNAAAMINSLIQAYAEYQVTTIRDAHQDYDPEIINGNARTNLNAAIDSCGDVAQKIRNAATDHILVPTRAEELENLRNFGIPADERMPLLGNRDPADVYHADDGNLVVAPPHLEGMHR